MGVKTPEYKDSEVSPIIFDNVVSVFKSIKPFFRLVWDVDICSVVK